MTPPPAPFRIRSSGGSSPGGWRASDSVRNLIRSCDPPSRRGSAGGDSGIDKGPGGEGESHHRGPRGKMLVCVTYLSAGVARDVTDWIRLSGQVVGHGSAPAPDFLDPTD